MNKAELIVELAEKAGLKKQKAKRSWKLTWRS